MYKYFLVLIKLKKNKHLNLLVVYMLYKFINCTNKGVDLRKSLECKHLEGTYFDSKYLERKKLIVKIWNFKFFMTEILYLLL